MSSEHSESYGMTVNEMKEIRTKLALSNGKEWDLSLGELQLQYGEACFWILLKNKSEAQQALKRFREVVGPFQEKWPQIKFTVSFSSHEGKDDISIDFLEGDEIQDDTKLRSIGSNLIVEPIKENDIFLLHRRRQV